MHSDQEVLPNELVQLQIVHVAAGADLRCMHDDEHVVRIHMDSGNVVTVLAFGDRDRMKLKVIRQDRLGVVAPLGMSSQRNPSVRFRTADSSANAFEKTSLKLSQRLVGAAACQHGAAYLLLSGLPHRSMNSRPTRGAAAASINTEQIA
jgi:hypothetical protein